MSNFDIIPKDKNDELPIKTIEEVNETNLSQATDAVLNIASREAIMLAINYVSGNFVSGNFDRVYEFTSGSNPLKTSDGKIVTSYEHEK